MCLFVLYCAALLCHRVHLSHFLRCFAPTEIRGVVVGTRALSWRLSPIAQEMSGHPPRCEATVEAVGSHAEKVFRAYFLSFRSFLRAYFLMGVPFFAIFSLRAAQKTKQIFSQTQTCSCVWRDSEILAQAAAWRHHSWPVRVSGLARTAQLVDD